MARYAPPMTTQLIKNANMRPGHGPTQREARDWKWTVHLSAQIRRPIRRREAAPHPLNRVDERIPDDDVQVVHGEPIPQCGQMWNDRAQNDRQIQPAIPTVHGSPRTASGRQTSDTSQLATSDKRRSDFVARWRKESSHWLAECA